MLSNENYSYVRILSLLGETLELLRKRGKSGAIKARHGLSVEMYKEMEADLEKHIEKLRLAIEGLAKEGKFK